jgi:hypothetical protein
MKYILFISLFACSTVFADPDAASQEAAQKTVELLNNPGARQAAIDENKETQIMDQKLESFAGDQKEAIYRIASEIFKSLNDKSGGDADKMKAILDEAQSNPEKFYNDYMAPQKNAVRDVANEIEKKQKHPPTSPPN